MSEVTQYSPRLDLQNRRNAIAKIEQSVNALAMPYTNEQVVFRSGAMMWLALARGWLGKALGTLGEAYPYPQSMDPSNSAIDAPAYVRLDALVDVHPTHADTVMAIKQARVDIESTRKFYGFNEFCPHPDGFDRCIASSATALDNAKMMLGEELGVLYESNKQEPAVA